MSTIISKINPLHSRRPLHAILRLCLVVASYLSSTAQANEPELWSRGFSSEPANSRDRASEFVLYDLSQEELNLIGRWSLTNGAANGKTPPRVIVPGQTTSDGIFWPDVTLQVRKKRTGKWKTIAKSQDNGQRTTVTIDPNATNFDLAVKLDAFKPLIGKYESGRIVLKGGRTSVFELKDLLPPEKQANSKNDSITH
jgi:hypothetical protein